MTPIAATFYLLTCFSLTSGPQFVADYPLHNIDECSNVRRTYLSTHVDESRSCTCIAAVPIREEPQE